MFHLLIAGPGQKWSRTRGAFDASRVFEHTTPLLVERFRPKGIFNQAEMTSIPAVFTSEISRGRPAAAYVGTITKIWQTSYNVEVEYLIENDLPTLTNVDLRELAPELGITEFEFSRTHWAIKDADLFKILMRHYCSSHAQPTVFTVAENWTVEDDLVAVMMPFSDRFKPVYKAIQSVSDELGFRCRRADDIWDHPQIMQDIFALLYRAGLTICDCSGRNPNVFYEAGIAHTLGREVILVSQSEDDVPFDLRHLRYIRYLNNTEGRRQLKAKLRTRFETLFEDR